VRVSVHPRDAQEGASNRAERASYSKPHQHPKMGLRGRPRAPLRSGVCSLAVENLCSTSSSHHHLRAGSRGGEWAERGRGYSGTLRVMPSANYCTGSIVVGPQAGSVCCDLKAGKPCSRKVVDCECGRCKAAGCPVNRCTCCRRCLEACIKKAGENARQKEKGSKQDGQVVIKESCALRYKRQRLQEIVDGEAASSSSACAEPASKNAKLVPDATLQGAQSCSCSRLVPCSDLECTGMIDQAHSVSGRVEKQIERVNALIAKLPTGDPSLAELELYRRQLRCRYH